jgi:hypothetical protein
VQFTHLTYAVLILLIASRSKLYVPRSVHLHVPEADQVVEWDQVDQLARYEQTGGLICGLALCIVWLLNTAWSFFLWASWVDRLGDHRVQHRILHLWLSIKQRFVCNYVAKVGATWHIDELWRAEPSKCIKVDFVVGSSVIYGIPADDLSFHYDVDAVRVRNDRLSCLLVSVEDLASVFHGWFCDFDLLAVGLRQLLDVLYFGTLDLFLYDEARIFVRAWIWLNLVDLTWFIIIVGLSFSHAAGWY